MAIATLGKALKTDMSKPAPVTAGETYMQSVEPTLKELQTAEEQKLKGEKEKADARIAERNCNDARGQLRQLQDGSRISRTDPNTGERIVLEEKDRPGEMANAQKSVDTWCKK